MAAEYLHLSTSTETDQATNPPTRLQINNNNTVAQTQCLVWKQNKTFFRV